MLAEFGMEDVERGREKDLRSQISDLRRLIWASFEI
jgi:hypothetical protein